MSGGQTNSSSTNSVPSWLQPYYQNTLTAGQNLVNQGGPAYYPGNQVAPLNQVQEGAINTQLQGLGTQEQGINAIPTGLNSINNAQNTFSQGLGTIGQGAGAIQGGLGQVGQGLGTQNQGVGSIMNTAMSPSASQGAINANRFETSGALLDPSSNPYLQDTFKQAGNAVQNQLSSEFAGSGRNIIGSLPVQSDQLNNLANQVYGGAYAQGLNTMTQASGMAAGIDQGAYLPGNELLNAGGQQLAGANSLFSGGNSLLNAGNAQLGGGMAQLQGGNAQIGGANALANAGQNLIGSGNSLLGTGAGLQNQTQNLINQNVNAWNYQQQLPYNDLSWLTNLLGGAGSPFRTQTGTVQGQGNAAAGALGGAASGAALGGAAAGASDGAIAGPWGVALGGLGGALAGYFGSR